MCQASQLYVALSGITSVSTANSNLDGTGSMSSVLTAAQAGTVLQTITIKATGSNEQGMIRFFIQPNGGSSEPFLWKEVPVPANVQSATNPAYQTTLRASCTLGAGDELFASTQNAETWNIIAEAMNWENCSCPE